MDSCVFRTNTSFYYINPKKEPTKNLVEWFLGFVLTFAIVIYSTIFRVFVIIVLKQIIINTFKPCAELDSVSIQNLTLVNIEFYDVTLNQVQGDEIVKSKNES